MQLKWAHYSVGMQPNGWGVDVVGLQDIFGADPGQPLRLLPDPPMNLGVRIHAPAGTAPEGHVLQATIKDATGKALSDTRTVPLEFIVLPTGNPLVGLGRVPLNDWTLPSIGRHPVDLAVDGAPVGQVPLVIAQRQGRLSQAHPAEAPPLRLSWAHFVMGFGEHPKLPGAMNLAGIFEVLPGVVGSSLKGALLLLQIESDLTIHTQRQLRAELLDNNNQKARHKDGRLIMAPFVRPITLRRLTPAWDFLVSTAPIRFHPDASLPLGEYRFQFSVDGQPLGDPLDLKVIPFQ